MLESKEGTRFTGEQYITLFSPDLSAPLVTTSAHPNWKHIKEALETRNLYDPETAVYVEGLINMTIGVARRFEKITDRVSVSDDGIITFDGDEIHNAITDQISKFIKEDIDFIYLVNFLEKLYQNPNNNSREQFYNWVQEHGLTINSDGNVLAYKGVADDGEGGYVSINRGEAIVDGEEVNGAVPNNPGSVVEIPRSKVNADINVPCSFGLHVGSYEYASGWGGQGIVLEIEVNPRDIVSVPADANNAKVRTCRYRVLKVIDKKHDNSYSDTSDYGYDPYDDDYYYEDNGF